MSEMATRIEDLRKACANPRTQMNRYLSEGKKVIGCFPVYAPEELVHASGMVPMGCWGAQMEVQQAGKYLPPFACSIMQTTLELGLKGAYEGMSAVIIPTLCDTFRCISQDWKYGVKSIPMIPVTYPQNRTIKAAEDFLISEYEMLLSRLSIITGNTLNDDSLDASIKVYNAHSLTMQRFSEVANKHLDVITPEVRHAVMKSAFFFEKSEHTEIVKDIIDGLEVLPEYEFKGKKIILSGILAEPDDLLRIFEESELAVVGDDLGQESRQYRTLIPEEGGSPIRRLAKQWLNRKACCLAHEDFKQRGELLVDLCKQNNADAVIYCLMKFCDPEEYDYPICKQTLKQAGISTLLLEIDQLSNSREQARTRVQSFSEML